MIGPENLAIEFADEEDRCRAAIERVTPFCIEAFERQVKPLLDAGLPTMSWLPCPTRGKGYIPSCDFSALVSEAMFRRSILPSIVEETRHADRAIYHLDGPDALRHLDALLEQPTIQAIQWVYGAGKGPAARWTDVYRRIQAGGKAMVVHAASAEDAAEVRRALQPLGVWFDVGESFSKDDAEALARQLA
jgi:hypothetical protein